MNNNEEAPEKGLLPERNLWGAVMEEAIKSLSSGSLRIRADAITWFRNRSNDGVGSFLWVCSILDLDPDNISNKLLEKFNKSKYQIGL